MKVSPESAQLTGDSLSSISRPSRCRASKWAKYSATGMPSAERPCSPVMASAAGFASTMRPSALTTITESAMLAMTAASWRDRCSACD